MFASVAIASISMGPRDDDAVSSLHQPVYGFVLIILLQMLSQLLKRSFLDFKSLLDLSIRFPEFMYFVRV